MSREVGSLSFFPGRDDKPEYFKGFIELAQVAGQIFLVPNKDKRSDNSPDYVLKLARNGRYVEVGAGWIKALDSGPHPEFLSITLDFDGLPQPINVAAFCRDEQAADEPQKWRVVWGRPRGGRARAPAADDLAGDGIPY